MTIAATRHLGVAGALIAGLLLLMPGAGKGDQPSWPVRFDSEIVRIYVEEDSLRIEGIYTLLCRPGKKMREARLFSPPGNPKRDFGSLVFSSTWAKTSFIDP